MEKFNYKSNEPKIDVSDFLRELGIELDNSVEIGDLRSKLYSFSIHLDDIDGNVETEYDDYPQSCDDERYKQYLESLRSVLKEDYDIKYAQEKLKISKTRLDDIIDTYINSLENDNSHLDQVNRLVSYGHVSGDYSVVDILNNSKWEIFRTLALMNKDNE